MNVSCGKVVIVGLGGDIIPGVFLTAMCHDKNKMRTYPLSQQTKRVLQLSTVQGESRVQTKSQGAVKADSRAGRMSSAYLMHHLVNRRGSVTAERLLAR